MIFHNFYIYVMLHPLNEYTSISQTTLRGWFESLAVIMIVMTYVIAKRERPRHDIPILMFLVE